MEAISQELVTFFLTGRRSGGCLTDVDGRGLKPVLFAGYQDLTHLRYDFPLVLVAGRSDAHYAQSLSAVVDSALASMVEAKDGERVRKHAMRIEREVRELLAAGAVGPLSVLWARAVASLAGSNDEAIATSGRLVQAAFTADGELVDCDASLPTRLAQHAWRTVQARKAHEFRNALDRLLHRLDGILRAEFERSGQARTAPLLRESVGSGFTDAFDFNQLSALLTKALPSNAMPERRRERIVGLIEILSKQQFFPPTASRANSVAAEPYRFLFTRCTDALSAYRERSAKLIELAKAIAIAELEVEGQYSEARHDAFFEQFGAYGLDPQELAAFPDYLVCLDAGRLSPAEHAQLLDILSSGLPIKVLVQIDDILEESAHGEGNLTTGTRTRQIASMAMGLNEVYVLQSSSSNLYRYREQLLNGLASRGPALFSIYSGASGAGSGVPPYLMAAAAMESRAFPAFSYDPAAGPDWASRFSLHANAQVELDWPMQSVTYEDDHHQRASEEIAFTFVDFVASDRRYAKHLALVPHDQWNARLVPVDKVLTHARRGLPEEVPSVFMVDGDSTMQKVVVDDRLIREARRCRELWHSLQELGGVHNSHAERLLARERKSWEARAQQEADAQAVESLVASVSAQAVSAAIDVPAEETRSPDEAWIETARCSTCNECTQINSRMFAYNDNKQAFIRDITAGTYAQLVEAAESCQVSIIHPGKPRNPGEAGLDRLLERAAAFQ